MTLVWDTPWMVVAAAPLGAGVAVLTRRGLGRARPAAAWGASVARGTAVVVALLAAAGPSVLERETVPGAALVAAADEDAPTASDADVVVRWPTDVASPGDALEAARGRAPAASPRVLSLIWPGPDRPPPSLDTAAALVRRGAATHVVARKLPRPATPLAPAPRLLLPAAAVEGVPCEIVIDAGETPFRGGTATFSFDGVDAPFPLPDGARRVSLPPVAARAGQHVVSVRFADRAPAAAPFVIAEAPSVLLVSRSGQDPALAARLRAQGLQVTTVSERTCDLADRADVVVLGPGTGAGCAADVASRAAAGSGLIVMGGEGDRGLARLRGTALEPLLPVELPAPPPPPEPEPPKPPDRPPPAEPDRPRPVLDEADREALRVALLLCIDRSGSMAGVKIAMAREAAVAAARTLSPGDRVGVVAFDEMTEWVAPFQDAGDVGGLVRRVQRLRAEGGTNFYPTLKEGFAAIVEQRCGIRHVVLITDGATRAAVFRDMVEGATAQGVTLSTVAVGDGADTRLLGLLAQWGRGRLYPAIDPEHLPQVITLDTKRFVHAARDAVRDLTDVPDVVPPPAEAPAEARRDPEPAPPKPPAGPAPRIPHVAFAAPFLAGIETEPWPALAHPESIRTRGAAAVPLVWDDGSPALVLGRAASGRCAVVAADLFTSDARDLWTWFEAGRALAQLVRSLAPPGTPADAAPEVRTWPLADGTAVAVVGAPGGGLLRLRPAGGGEELRVVCRPAGELSVAALARPLADGVHVGEFAASGADRSVPVVAASAGAAPRDDDGVLQEIAARSGAAVVATLPSAPDAPPSERRDDRSAPLLVGAAVLLLVDAGLRRSARG